MTVSTGKRERVSSCDPFFFCFCFLLLCEITLMNLSRTITNSLLNNFFIIFVLGDFCNLFMNPLSSAYGGHFWKTDVWLWILASLMRDLKSWIQPRHDSLKFYFDNLYANPACRSMFLISDQENVLKPFQQNIISEVEREFSVKDFDFLHSACCISPFSSFNTPRIQTRNKCF